MALGYRCTFLLLYRVATFSPEIVPPLTQAVIAVAQLCFASSLARCTSPGPFWRLALGCIATQQYFCGLVKMHVCASTSSSPGARAERRPACLYSPLRYVCAELSSSTFLCSFLHASLFVSSSLLLVQLRSSASLSLSSEKMGFPVLGRKGRGSNEVNPDRLKRRKHHLVPWIENPCKGADVQELVFHQRHEANTVELFFDLFFVANLATFTAYHSITDDYALYAYIGYGGFDEKLRCCADWEIASLP